MFDKYETKEHFVQENVFSFIVSFHVFNLSIILIAQNELYTDVVTGRS